MCLPNKSTTLYGESSSNASYNAQFHSNTISSAYNRPVHHNSPEEYSTQRSSTPTFLVPSTFSTSTRNSIDLTSLKHASITASSTVVGTSVSTNSSYFTVNNSPSFSSAAIRNTYIPHQNVPDMIYSPLTKHFFWNTNFFHSQPRPTHESLSSHHLSNISARNNSTSFSINSKITDSSNCSDVNSDSDSLDVDDYGNESTANVLQKKQETDTISSTQEVKKRNPYSIEELLKKPEKRLRHIESASFEPSIIVNDDSLRPSPQAVSEIKDNEPDTESPKSSRNSQIAIEVYD